MAEESVPRQKMDTRSSVRIRSDSCDSISSVHNNEQATASASSSVTTISVYTATIKTPSVEAVVQKAGIVVPSTASATGRRTGIVVPAAAGRKAGIVVPATVSATGRKAGIVVPATGRKAGMLVPAKVPATGRKSGIVVPAAAGRKAGIVVPATGRKAGIVVPATVPATGRRAGIVVPSRGRRTGIVVPVRTSATGRKAGIVVPATVSATGRKAGIVVPARASATGRRTGIVVPATGRKAGIVVPVRTSATGRRTGIVVPSRASAGRRAGDGARGGKVGGATPSTPIAATTSTTANTTVTTTPASSSGTQLSLVNLQAQKVNEKKRNHCFWPAEEKDMFFDALNEYGKDFDAIQNVFSMRSKRKSENYLVPKTKDQIRHFYYRTWNKISKYVKQMEGISKDVLEIYGLINYGHLRKKVGSKMDSKIGNKLNALIQYGTILITVKCKNTRIRTPLCRALKKLNNIEFEETHCKINMVPYDNRAWFKVQALSLNPRLSIKLRMDAMLSDVFSYLNSRWPIYAKDDHMILKFILKEKLDTNPLNFKRADVRLMSNYIVNKNGKSRAAAAAKYADDTEDETEDESARLESQREMDEALKHLRNLQKVIEEFGGFTSAHIENITINRLRAALQTTEDIVTIHYEWVSEDSFKPPNPEGGAIDTPTTGANSISRCAPADGDSILRTIIHLATSEYIKLERLKQQAIIEKQKKLDDATNSLKSQKKVQNLKDDSCFKVPYPPGTVIVHPRKRIRRLARTVPPKLPLTHSPLTPSPLTPYLLTHSPLNPSPLTPSPLTHSQPEPRILVNKELPSLSLNVIKPVVNVTDAIKTTKEDDWSISSDFSLSSYLYDSPEKKNPTTQIATGVAAGPSEEAQSSSAHSSSTQSSSAQSLMDDSSICQMDVGGVLLSLINESSLDYAAKFADLTAKFTHDKQNHP